MVKRDSLPGLVARTIITSAVASTTSALALTLLARAERRDALRPLNATSHWLHGGAAARNAKADVRHTAVGAVTHHLAAMFWSAVLRAFSDRATAHCPNSL